MLVVAFVPSEPLYETLVAVTFWPDWLKPALQPWETASLPGRANASVQFVSAEPRFVMEMLAVKPPGHEFAVYETWHPLAALADWARVTAATPVVTSTAAVAAAIRFRACGAVPRHLGR